MITHSFGYTLSKSIQKYCETLKGGSYLFSAILDFLAQKNPTFETAVIIQEMLDLHKILLEYNVHCSILFCATIAIQS